MIAKIANLRDFRKKLTEYINRAVKGRSIIVKSKDREVVLLSMREYRELTGDETKYLLFSESNREHLLEGIRQIEKGQTEKLSIDELLN